MPLKRWIKNRRNFSNGANREDNLKIGVIVYSNTGNTLRFGRVISEKLKDDGHDVNLIELRTNVPVVTGSATVTTEFEIINIPDCSGYDAVLIGSPVWGFSASTVIMSCIGKITGLEGKTAIPFVTKSLPFKFTGGKQAVSKMLEALEKAGAKVLPGKIVTKNSRKVNELYEKRAAEIAEYFADV